MKPSPITWTDYSGGCANFIMRGRNRGDCEISPGCQNCYAARILRQSTLTPARTTLYPEKLQRLARWQPAATERLNLRRGPDSQPLVLLCDMGDIFHPAVPPSFLAAVFDVLARRTDITWQVLTKRADRLAQFAADHAWPENVWAGVTVEDQARADERIPLLLKVPARVRFLSCEPLLEPLDLHAYLLWPRFASSHTDYGGREKAIQWVIVGGESGPQRRPFDAEWARDLRDQCQAAGVSFFYKQGSARRPGADNRLDGQTYLAIPPDGGT